MIRQDAKFYLTGRTAAGTHSIGRDYRRIARSSRFPPGYNTACILPRACMQDGCSKNHCCHLFTPPYLTASTVLMRKLNSFGCLASGRMQQRMQPNRSQGALLTTHQCQIITREPCANRERIMRMCAERMDDGAIQLRHARLDAALLSLQAASQMQAVAHCKPQRRQPSSAAVCTSQQPRSACA